jgi:uncharacterized protein (TIGR03435 family)
MRMMGYKVSFAEVIAAAYACAPNRVILPPEAPKGDYDFLVTLPEKPNEHLQAAIKKKLGWVASWEPRETEVLLLKVKTPNASALHLSTNGQNTSLSVQNGRLQATHLRLGYLSGLLENTLKHPVLDQTGQTNYYDFSVEWDPNQYPDVPDLAAVNKIMGQIGLELQSDTASMLMVVVKKAS